MPATKRRRSSTCAARSAASRGLPPVYGREALTLTHAEIAEFEADGRKPHWRFLLPNFAGDPFEPERTEVHWTDLVRGEETVDLASLSDPVLVREDGTYLYTLPSVVDDIDMGISHVIRGDDHVTNTGVQIALFKALGAEPPAFGHHNLLTTATGEGLSKRTGALSIAGLREAGIEPMAVASLAVLIGTSENVDGVAAMAELAERFDLGGDLQIGVEVRSGRPHRAQPRRCFTTCRSRKRATGWWRSAFPAIRPRRSGWRCAAISTRSPTPRDWWRIVRDGPESRPELSDEDRRLRARGLRPAAAGAVGPRHLEDLDRAGQGGDAAARARRCSCRCGSRLPDFLPGRSLQIYCPFWVGKEHWPDDPDLALAGWRRSAAATASASGCA